ncbi:cytochrome P450 [Amycolatopsis sp. Poz14]|uniref:cytochrome P450 n=1 Tax=Amycolatopsis sp. Poz14 TaxID=1447705 RepID=UPI001EE91DEC|nr:cytochrome P450 [Amycolatopsis sp. Poz14]MCG3754018.1 cytochrome P450 [Amycolatopsis sp. Poz14]
MDTVVPDLMKVPQETSFDDVGRLLRARDLAPLPRDAARPVLGNALVSLHGAAHRQRRISENKLFSPDALRRYEEDILEPSVREAFAALSALPEDPERAAVNLPAFVTELILNISIALIGIDRRGEADRKRIYEFIDPLIAAHEIEWSTEDSTAAIARAADAQSRFWTEFLEPAYRRRQAAHREGGWTEPADLLSVLASPDSGIDDDTAAQECALYLIASVFTTTSTITNTVELVSGWCEEHPADRDLVLDSSSDFLSRCVEEALRVRPPIKPLLLRQATADASVGGCPVSAGATVGANVAAAHADPAVYPDRPEKFDPTRAPAVQVRRTHYSFGDGPHLCIGRPLVVGDPRAETEGDAAHIVRAFFAADVRTDPSRPRRFASTARKRYIDYPVTVRIAR